MTRTRAYYVYIMASYSRVLYTGVTGDLERRMWQHKNGAGSTFTARYRTTRLVYNEETIQVIDALEREKQIKGLLRAKKIALIESVNPNWRDLSDAWFRAR